MVLPKALYPNSNLERMLQHMVRQEAPNRSDEPAVGRIEGA